MDGGSAPGVLIDGRFVALQNVMRATADIAVGERYINRIGVESVRGFHTGYRESSPGGDEGSHGLDKYLRKKTVYVNYSGAATAPLMSCPA